MKLKQVKFWADNQAVFDHLYQTFVVERAPYNFLNDIPVYIPVAGAQGCAIGNLLTIQHAWALHKLSKQYMALEDIELVLTKPPVINDTIKLIQRIFSNVDVAFLSDVQRCHDSRNLRETTFISLSDYYDLTYRGVRQKIKIPKWEDLWKNAT